MTNSFNTIETPDEERAFDFVIEAVGCIGFFVAIILSFI